MGSLFRSEPMAKCQLFLQADAAFASVAELGELGLVQFNDLNSEVTPFQRKFVNEVRRCAEMERKLTYIGNEIAKDKIPILDTGENPDAPQPKEMNELEATFEKLENELREVNTNEETLRRNFLELLELKHSLNKTQFFFEEHPDERLVQVNTSDVNPNVYYNGGHTNPNVVIDEPAEELAETQAMHRDKAAVNFITGVIRRDKLMVFERLIWRASFGNAFVRHSEIEEPLEDPASKQDVIKCVFIVFFSSEQLKIKIKKICQAFHATLYPCPATAKERREVMIGVHTRIEDLKTVCNNFHFEVLHQTEDHRHRVLVSAAKHIRIWMAKVQKLEAIFHTLNQFNVDVTQKCFIAECWVPLNDVAKIQIALKRGTELSGCSVPSFLNRIETDETPPTFFRTNKFTAGFQTIIDAYGVATYQEVNPSPYTIITFPFLFAVMFGDAGHGTLMLLFALFMVLKEKALAAKKIQDEIFQTFFGGRYIILLMGCFSIYTGLIYNDVFSKSIKIFDSSWKMPTKYDMSTLEHNEKLQIDPAGDGFEQRPYTFGIDPAWAMADNKLLFLNSFKMKMSVSLGVFQMLFGVVLSCINHVHFRQPLNIFCEFIPQVLFLSSIFLYLVFQVFYKWLVFGAAAAVDGPYPGSHCAPSLLIGLINMFMFKHEQYGWPHPNDPQCSMSQFYRGQAIVESILVILAVLCIPWMLLIKPIVLNLRNKQQKKQTVVVFRAHGTSSTHAIDVNAEPGSSSSDGGVERSTSVTSTGGKGGGHGHDDHGEFSFGDAFIHQCIHTIEFCLGCISHTASYLRLWALSLAHAELSETVWTMVLQMVGFKMAYGKGPILGGIFIYVIFAFFAVLTIAILCVMEGLSAFLHALRLHWVEFNSKFYRGEGYAFTPFSFETILEEAGQNKKEIK